MWYNWNIVESGVKHQNPNIALKTFFFILNCILLKIKVKSNNIICCGTHTFFQQQRYCIWRDSDIQFCLGGRGKAANPALLATRSDTSKTIICNSQSPIQICNYNVLFFLRFWYIIFELYRRCSILIFFHYYN